MENNFDLSVIIVSWNVRRLLDECLDSVEKSIASLNAEIYVVDNASHDGSPQMVSEKHPAVHLIANPDNRGFGKANNQALRLCQGKYALILNPDTLVSPAAVRRLFDFMEAHPQAGLAGPEQCDQDGNINMVNLARMLPREFFEYAIERLLSLGQPRHRVLITQPRQISMVNAACWMVRSTAMKQIGLFNEDLFLYGEEKDVCPRLQQLGWQIWFLRDTQIVHYRHQSLGQQGLIQDLVIHARSKLFRLARDLNLKPFPGSTAAN
jgi:GT2 family glycosyltransferase